MKRVNFKIAKVIKEAGYPQDEVKITEIGWYNQAGVYTKELPFLWKGDDAFVAIAPTYLSVWLWLCENGSSISPICIHPNQWQVSTCNGEWKNPEEAIIKAIEYLVDNNLIK